MIGKILIQRGETLFQQPRVLIEFTHEQNADQLLNKIEVYPHAFVLACLMDRQVKAERAWRIPYEVASRLGDFSMPSLATVSLSEWKTAFAAEKLHRFNAGMAAIWFSGIKRIAEVYDGHADAIWNGNPSSASVVYRFLEFDGDGPKIATMAANILARDFKVPMSDHYSIDVSVDTHVRRVLVRTGLVPPHSTFEMVIYRAREINPPYPGVIDLSCWEIGRNWCHPRNPNCTDCPLASGCARIGGNDFD